MNPNTFDTYIGADEAVRMAHVKLHKDNGKAYVFPRSSENDDQEGEQVQAGAATASGYKYHLHNVMVSHIVPHDTEGLETAEEIDVTDFNVPPLLLSGTDLERCKMTTPFILPKDKLLKSKPERGGNSKRSKRRAKERAAKGTGVVLPEGTPDKKVMHHVNLRGVALPDELKKYLKTSFQTAKEKGIPDWELILDTYHTVNGGRSLSKELPVYREKVVGDIDRKATTASLRETAYHHVVETQRKLVKGFRPNGDCIMGELHKFMAQRPYYKDEDGYLAPDNVQIFRDWLLYSRHMLTSVDKVKKVVFAKHLVVSTGILPVTQLRLEQEIEDLSHVASLKELPTKNKKQEDPVEQDDDSPEAREKNRNARLAAKADLYRRIAPVIKNVHELPAAKEKPKQNEEHYAQVNFVEHPNVRSSAVIRHVINYLDPEKKDEQPRHIFRVELTHNNTWGPRDEEKKDNQYIATHRVADVTDAAWQSSLEKIFPQTTKIDNYFHDLYGTVTHVSQHRLYLVTMKLNGQHSTSNLLTRDDDVPPVMHDLRAIVRKPSMVFMLIRGSDVPDQVESLIKRFTRMAKEDPLNEFFVEPHNPYLSHKGVKPIEELPKFTSPPQIQYEEWNDFVRQTALAALLELRFAMPDQKYNAQVAMVPIPATKKRDANVFMSYHMQTSIKLDPSKPRLMPGDHVTIDLNPDPEAPNAPEENRWHGKVTYPTNATPMGMINIAIERRLKDGSLADSKEYSTLTEARLADITITELVKWAQTNCNKDVIICTNGSEKECKRIMNNMATMCVPRKLLEIYAEKEQRLKPLRELLLCKDHTQGEAIPVYQGLNEDFRDRAIAYIQALLRPHQLDWFNFWMDEGAYDNNLFITGPSGAGKTYLEILTLLPYLGDVEVPSSLVNIAKHERDVTFQIKAKKAKAKKKAAKVKAAENKDDENKDKNDKDKDDENKDEDKDDKSKDDKAKADTEAEAPNDKDDGDEPGEPADPEKSDSTVVERGRITIAAMQNETVDNIYQLASAMAVEFAKSMDLPPPLVLRLHSKEAELGAVRAMARPTYNPTIQDTRFNIDPSVKVVNETARALLNAYVTAYNGGSPGIADPRFKRLEGSAAKYIMEMADFPEFPPSPELRGAFSRQELKAWREDLKDIISAHEDLRVNNDSMNRDIKVKINAAAKRALEALFERASIICTTMANATQASFNITRRAHAIALEEAGRARDAEIVGIFSHYYDAQLRILSGATNQLHPMAFGNSKENPFHKTAETSTLARIAHTGGNVSYLHASSRYKNPELLQLCAMINEEPDITAVEGAFDPDLSKEYAQINKNIWGIDSNLIFINTRKVRPQKNANNSMYCTETAAVTMKDAVERTKYMKGKDHAIITPYNAQVDVLCRQRDYAAQAAAVRGDYKLAKELMDIEITTIDSYMGKDNLSVTVDTVGNQGHFFQYGRVVVATTRARLSQTIVGPSWEYTSPTSKIRSDHPFAKVIRWLNKAKCIKAIDYEEIQALEQYDMARQAAGLDLMDEPRALRQSSLVASIIYNLGEDDEDELEIIKIMRKYGSEPFHHKNAAEAKMEWAKAPDTSRGWTNDNTGSNDTAGGWDKVDNSDNATAGNATNATDLTSGGWDNGNATNANDTDAEQEAEDNEDDSSSPVVRTNDGSDATEDNTDLYEDPAVTEPTPVEPVPTDLTPTGTDEADEDDDDNDDEEGCETEEEMEWFQ